jgi:SRSO17 transposase
MLGKQDNCQVAVSVSLACQGGSLPVAWQLYLPKDWADDMPRRDKAGVPQDVEFATKPEIALAQIERLLAQGAPKHPLLADAGYGVDTAFRERLSELGLTYVVGVTGAVTVWPPGHAPLPPQPYSGRGNVPTRQRVGQGKHQRPQSIKELAFELAPSQWQIVEWREGSNFTLRSRFARVRAYAAHRDHQRTQRRAEEWVLIEWPEGHKEPMKYWLSTLAEDVPLQRMVFEAKMRWRIERDYQDLKQEVGLGHYEGRGWRGFHHHASLSIAAYGFLMEQQLGHPKGVGKKNAPRREEPALPTHYKPRGSPAHAAPRPIVHHDFAAAYRRSLTPDAAPMPLLPARKRKASLVTQ